MPGLGQILSYMAVQSTQRRKSSVYGMSAIGAHRQEGEQRYLDDTGPDHGVGRPKRQTAQTQKLKIGDGIKDTGLDTCAAGREDAAQPGGQRPRHCHCTKSKSTIFSFAYTGFLNFPTDFLTIFSRSDDSLGLSCGDAFSRTALTLQRKSALFLSNTTAATT